MFFNCYKPHPLLQKFIKCYSFIEGNFENINIRPIADGSTVETSIVINNNFKVKYLGNKDIRDFKSCIGGLVHKVDYFRLSGHIEYIGIVMYPYTLRFLFNEEPKIFMSHIDFKDFFGESGRLLIEQIQSSDTYFQKVNYLNRFFIGLLKSKKEIDSKSQFLFSDLLNLNRITKMTDLSNYMNTTPRTLQRYFNDVIGVCPKEFLKITRINKIINEIKINSKLSVHDIVNDYHYFDQSHLISEVKKYTGYTLNQLMENIRQNTIPYSRNLIFEKN